MTKSEQRLFDELFSNQVYQPTNGFEPREWQLECLNAYQNSIANWKSCAVGNGNHEQHRFCIYAGTGSGKTKAAGLLVAHAFNVRHIRQVVIVVPNKSIMRKTIADFKEFFRIHLVRFQPTEHADGISRKLEGYILTYAHLMQDPAHHQRICDRDTLVIFDEVHHLGDSSTWGTSALESFGRVDFVLSLTGTPYRSDNTRIPFVTYTEQQENGLWRFKADHQYTLGRAVDEGVCRKPIFHFASGTVALRLNDTDPEKLVEFNDNELTDEEKQLRLAGAVRYSSSCRKSLLRSALDQCRAEHRKVAIFLGGDTEGDHTPTQDAQDYLPSELSELGIQRTEIEIVTGQDKNALDKISSFGADPEKWILVSINMISEGTDIPELSAGIFLTSVTSKLTTLQRIGRLLRLMGESDPFPDALVFMFRDPNLEELANEINTEIMAECKLRKKTREEAEGSPAAERRHRAESIGVGGGEIELVKIGAHQWPIDIVNESRAKLMRLGLPATMLQTLLSLMEGADHVASR